MLIQTRLGRLIKGLGPNTYGACKLDDLLPTAAVAINSVVLRLNQNMATGDTGSLHTGIAIGMGWPNTVQMSTSCDFGVANAVRAYHGGGKVDWFVPSIDEFHAMCIKRLL